MLVAPMAAGSGAAMAPPVVEPDDSPVSDRLLRQLYGLGRPQPEGPIPVGFSQEGLASALQKPQGGIARALQRLEESGLIVSEVAHVQGRRRRVKVYRLTPRGESAVRRLPGRQ
jgi:DNA-binding MarR family transcriptional regulator